ncbi:hypothetical protein FF38_01139 [Lucilia cuprina]|uniref:Uncharacterized protein n=1 Tax=Lucilia cuprina TaxID=7375 RepID=A0A0L0C1T8_LUCCU|nr:hypothetical protein FF38_01139 [Lucilia cuprina]
MNFAAGKVVSIILLFYCYYAHWLERPLRLQQLLLPPLVAADSRPNYGANHRAGVCRVDNGVTAAAVDGPNVGLVDNDFVAAADVADAVGGDDDEMLHDAPWVGGLLFLLHCAYPYLIYVNCFLSDYPLKKQTTSKRQQQQPNKSIECLVKKENVVDFK